MSNENAMNRTAEEQKARLADVKLERDEITLHTSHGPVTIDLRAIPSLQKILDKPLSSFIDLGDENKFGTERDKFYKELEKTPFSHLKETDGHIPIMLGIPGFGTKLQGKLTIGLDNPKKLATIVFCSEKDGVYRNRWNIVNLEELFAGVEWIATNTSPLNQWYEKTIRAWLPGEFPICKEPTTASDNMLLVYGEVEVRLTTYDGYPTINGNINVVPESTQITINRHPGFFTMKKP